MLTVRVLGHGWSLWDDLDVCDPCDLTVAVNRAAISYEGVVDHWVTLHPEKLAHWRRLRGERPDRPVTWSRREPRIVDRIVSHSWGGGSGMLAVRVALEHLQAGRVILCGMPIDGGPHAGEETPWKDSGLFRPDWEKRADELRGRVVSLSGWTRDLLGGPEVWDAD